MRKKGSKREHKKLDSGIKELLSLHTTIGDDITKAFALKVGQLHQRPDLEKDTKVALCVFLILLRNHAIGFPQIMALIEDPVDTSLKNYLFKSITDQEILKELDILYDELEEITGNRAFR